MIVQLWKDDSLDNLLVDLSMRDNQINKSEIYKISRGSEMSLKF